MCFMRDVSRHSVPLVRTTAAGHVDYDHYKELAHRERVKAQREAFSAMGRWLRGLFSAAPAGHSERLG